MKGLKIFLWFLISLTIIFNLESVKCNKGADPPKPQHTTATGSGGVAGRRPCVGKLTFYQGEEIVQEIE